jgi:membrane protein YqaA with SNARE-associated domain
VPIETVALGPGLDSPVLQSVAATAAVVGVATLDVGPALPAVGSLGLSDLVETATGPVGLVLIFVYSFLIAFALPGVSEIVLAAPLELGLSQNLRFTLIILVSSVGKAAGSVLAFHVGQEAKQSGPVERVIRRSRFDVLEWSERSVVRIGRRYGYLGLAAFLSVPGLPDTLSIYAFSVIEADYVKFSVATFVGSVNRLVLTLVGVELLLALL